MYAGMNKLKNYRNRMNECLNSEYTKNNCYYDGEQSTMMMMMMKKSMNINSPMTLCPELNGSTTV